jgi:hypothetical protein
LWKHSSGSRGASLVLVGADTQARAGHQALEDHLALPLGDLDGHLPRVTGAEGEVSDSDPDADEAVGADVPPVVCG